jgi:hypothetical protein
MPALFSDPLYQRAAKWTLSTSAIFSKHFPAYGWVGTALHMQPSTKADSIINQGEVVPDGVSVTRTQILQHANHSSM